LTAKRGEAAGSAERENGEGKRQRGENAAKSSERFRGRRATAAKWQAKSPAMVYNARHARTGTHRYSGAWRDSAEIISSRRECAIRVVRTRSRGG